MPSPPSTSVRSLERTTDADVLQASIDDPDAFAELFRRHHRVVLSYTVRAAGAAIGEDVAAEVFVAAFRARSTFDRAFPNALPWLLGIATNLLRHHHRHESVRRRHTRTEAALIDLRDQPLDDRWHAATAATAAADRIHRALGGLPEADRETLLLHVWGELTYAEIGAVLGVPMGTVRSRINRAKRRLRSSLGDLRLALDHGAAFDSIEGELRRVGPRPEDLTEADSQALWTVVAARTGLSEGAFVADPNDGADVGPGSVRRSGRPRAAVAVLVAAAVVVAAVVAGRSVLSSAPDDGPGVIVDVAGDPSRAERLAALRTAVLAVEATDDQAQGTRRFRHTGSIAALDQCWPSGDIVELRDSERISWTTGAARAVPIADCPVSPAPPARPPTSGSPPGSTASASEPGIGQGIDLPRDLVAALVAADSLLGSGLPPADLAAAFDRLAATGPEGSAGAEVTGAGLVVRGEGWSVLVEIAAPGGARALRVTRDGAEAERRLIDG